MLAVVPHVGGRRKSMGSTVIALSDPESARRRGLSLRPSRAAASSQRARRQDDPGHRAGPGGGQVDDDGQPRRGARALRLSRRHRLLRPPQAHPAPALRPGERTRSLGRAPTPLLVARRARPNGGAQPRAPTHRRPAREPLGAARLRRDGGRRQGAACQRRLRPARQPSVAGGRRRPRAGARGRRHPGGGGRIQDHAGGCLASARAARPGRRPSARLRAQQPRSQVGVSLRLVLQRLVPLRGAGVAGRPPQGGPRARTLRTTGRSRGGPPR